MNTPTFFRSTPTTRILLSASVFSLVLGASVQAGTFSTAPLTGDADSGISADAFYTHALVFGQGNNLSVNGAVFTGLGTNPTTNNLASSGIGNIFTGFSSPVTGAANDLFDNFVYGGNPAELTLNNLRVGQSYVTTFYNSAFGGAGGRVGNISTSDGGVLLNFDQNAVPSGRLLYSFIATASTMKFTFAPNIPSDTFHQYALSNRAVGYKALLTDNFYAPGNPNTSDVNFNLAARQGGSLVQSGGPISYIADGNTQVGNSTGAIDNGNYLLSAFGARTALNHNFNGAESAGGLSISFDFAPNSVGNGDTTVWAGISLGMADADKLSAINGPASHFGLLLRSNGLIQAFDAGTLVSNDQSWGAGATNALNHIELLLSDPTDSNPFNGVGQTDVAVYSNGALIYNFSKTGGGYSDNFLNLTSAFISGVDNLVVAQASPVPEPSTAVALLGGLGILLGLRRRS